MLASFLDYDFTSPLPHPGEILREAYLAPHNMTADALAKAMGLDEADCIERIVSERKAITADTALRLERVFGASAQFWMNLQSQYDLSMAAIESRAELKALRPLAISKPQ